MTSMSYNDNNSPLEKQKLMIQENEGRFAGAGSLKWETRLAYENEVLSTVTDSCQNRWAQRLQTHKCGLLCYPNFVSDV